MSSCFYKREFSRLLAFDFFSPLEPFSPFSSDFFDLASPLSYFDFFDFASFGGLSPAFSFDLLFDFSLISFYLNIDY